jgi:TPR repeat protein
MFSALGVGALHAASPATNSSTDPFEAMRRWWFEGQPLPKAGSAAAVQMTQYYATHPDDPDVLYWTAIAQVKGIVSTNRSTRDLIRDAADRHQPEAMARLGLVYLQGDQTTPDPARGLGLIREAYAKGSSDGAIQLGRAYLHATGVEKDLTQAEQYLTEAVAKGNIRSHAVLADLYRAHGETSKQLDEIRAGATAGDENAMLMLAESYRDGTLGLDRDPKSALKWMANAAQLGQTAAQREVAKMIFAGYAGLAHDDQNRANVRKLLVAAADARDPEAMRMLARLYLTADMGVPYDPERVLSLLRQAADTGDPAALYELGVTSVEGLIVPRDLRRAEELMNKSAAKGYEPAKQYLHRLTPAAATQPAVPVPDSTPQSPEPRSGGTPVHFFASSKPIR